MASSPIIQEQKTTVIPLKSNASIVAARATGTNEAFGIASWALIGVLRLWKHFGGFLMHVDVCWVLWTLGMFDLCFVEIRLWLVVEGGRRPCGK